MALIVSRYHLCLAFQAFTVCCPYTVRECEPLLHIALELCTRAISSPQPTFNPSGSHTGNCNAVHMAPQLDDISLTCKYSTARCNKNEHSHATVRKVTNSKRPSGLVSTHMYSAVSIGSVSFTIRKAVFFSKHIVYF